MMCKCRQLPIYHVARIGNWNLRLATFSHWQQSQTLHPKSQLDYRLKVNYPHIIPRHTKSCHLKNITITSVNFHSSKSPSPEVPESLRISPLKFHTHFSSIFALKKVGGVSLSSGIVAVAVLPSEKSLSETVAEEIGWSAGFLNASSVAAP